MSALSRLNSDNLIEGLFWMSWCGVSVSGWSEAVSKRKSLDHLPDQTVEKTEKIWEANQKLIIQTFSLVSGLSMVLAWLHDVKLLPLGLFGPIINCLGYGGSCLVSLSKAWEAMKEVNQGIEDYFKIKDPRAQHNMALLQIQNMMKGALFTCAAGWAAFGSVHAVVGGATLFVLMDSCFYYALLAFIANLTFLLIKPLLESP